jgi:hypothetical protein
MAKDWSGSAWHDVLFDVTPMPRPGDAAERLNLRLVERFGLPGLCLLAGLMAAVVYAWPALLLAHFLFDLTAVVFWSILGGVVVVGSVAAFAVTLWERGYWHRNRHNVSDWADPAPWE